MSLWDRLFYLCLFLALALGAEGINELREHEFFAGVIIVNVALGVVGLSQLIRWFERRS